MTSPHTATPTAGCPHLQFPFPTPGSDPLGLGAEWEQARRDGDLVQVRLPDGQAAWLAISYSAVSAVLRHTDTARATADGIAPFSRLGNLITSKDGLEHRRIRRLAAAEFAYARVARHHARISELAEDLIDAMVATGGHADLLDALGFPLPLTIIGELLGVPGTDRDQFREWADGLLVGADRAEEGMAALAAMIDYTTSLIDQRRRSPADDLATAIGARASDTGVSDHDAALLAVALIVGGFETTAAALAAGVYRLLTTSNSGRTAYQYLHEHPEAVPGAVEELLRLVPSTYIAALPPRRATADIVINGATIKSGELIIAAHDAANRAPNVFSDPQRFDLARPNAADHLAFGQGAHVCMGSGLARLGLQAMLAALTRKVPTLRLADDIRPIVWNTERIIRRPRALPVTWNHDTEAAIGS